MPPSTFPRRPEIFRLRALGIPCIIAGSLEVLASLFVQVAYPSWGFILMLGFIPMFWGIYLVGIADRLEMDDYDAWAKAMWSKIEED